MTMKPVIYLKNSSGKQWGDYMKNIILDPIWNEVTVTFSGSDRELMRFLREYFHKTVENAHKCNDNDVLITDTEIYMYKKSVYELCELLAAIGE